MRSIFSITMPTKNKSSEIDFASQVDFSAVLTNPILDIAARVWDSDRYDAFKVTYRAMRVIDDLVDERKAREDDISDSEKQQIEQMIRSWTAAMLERRPPDAFGEELLEVLDRFAIPTWPFERLSKAMIYDLHHDGFASVPMFLRYCEGAAIAPASIFTHLCGLTLEGEKYAPPAYDIRAEARPLALFSYLVHIVRDFEKDQCAGLNYFADSLVAEFSLDRTELEKIAKGAEPSDSFRKLISHYKSLADRYRSSARTKLDQLLPRLEPRYQLSLELIYNLYLQIFDKIDPESGTFTAEALNPTESEVQARIEETLGRFSPKK